MFKTRAGDDKEIVENQREMGNEFKRNGIKTCTSLLCSELWVHFQPEALRNVKRTNA